MDYASMKTLRLWSMTVLGHTNMFMQIKISTLIKIQILNV